MRTERPGEASVQYDDLRGEAAADIADEFGTLNKAVQKLGFKVNGTVVGISMYGSPVFDDQVHVTIQVVSAGSWEEIKAATDASGGTLKVTEHAKEIPLVDFMKCFKRLSVSLFIKGHDVRELEVTEAPGE